MHRRPGLLRSGLTSDPACPRGDRSYLSYEAANPDPKVFDDPLRFELEWPNASRQISFGHDVHVCLGARLARLEPRSLFGHSRPSLDRVEPAGDPETSETTFVGGHETLPISCALRRGERVWAGTTVCSG